MYLSPGGREAGQSNGWPSEGDVDFRLRGSNNSKHEYPLRDSSKIRHRGWCNQSSFLSSGIEKFSDS